MASGVGLLMLLLLLWQVPVGPECLGRIMNVIGEPVDEVGPICESCPVRPDAVCWKETEVQMCLLFCVQPLQLMSKCCSLLCLKG